MSSIEFLTLQEILEIHTVQLELFGGSPGLRDQGLLEAALAQPESTFDGEYLHHDLFEMASAYLYHLVQNHPFVDGNKRVGTASAIIFLSLNGVDVNPGLDKLEPRKNHTRLQKMILRVASGQMQKHEVAEFLRRHSKAGKP